MPATKVAVTKLTIRSEGKMVSLGSTIEITTMTVRKPIESLPMVEDVAAAILRWEKENQKGLAKLAVLTRLTPHGADVAKQRRVQGVVTGLKSGDDDNDHGSRTSSPRCCVRLGPSVRPRRIHVAIPRCCNGCAVSFPTTGSSGMETRDMVREALESNLMVSCKQRVG
ncbi:conserved hypothetical protein [Verticillium alfalfae VaMs.102]|uniref:Uncharacterized protein n=1 Tax=Verticillium alfalfae (strain VaMs.102 / ATCC MYA-4576 / FGSC 10136) TaxID=526221 RepID=C9S5W6_VERA1|nr:conserved hypothetical protein [Verticillium alfalfae VaMs.102]EEY15105.1 conserved hypothetical protein [Verticillium alfalfae VaMs.102]